MSRPLTFPKKDALRELAREHARPATEPTPGPADQEPEAPANSSEASNVVNNVPTNEVKNERYKEPKPAFKGFQALPDPADPDRWQRAQEISSECEIEVVTVRAPEKLNDYLDRYVERRNRANPKERYRKQDAVREMFAWFYAAHPMPPAPQEEFE